MLLSLEKSNKSVVFCPLIRQISSEVESLTPAPNRRHHCLLVGREERPRLG